VVCNWRGFLEVVLGRDVGMGMNCSTATSVLLEDCFAAGLFMPRRRFAMISLANSILLFFLVVIIVVLRWAL
jgi:hypothetical protein